MGEQSRQLGIFSWCELMTTDMEAAKRFYTTLFGWNTEDMSMPGMSYTVVKAGANSIGGIMQIPKESQGIAPAWGPYVTVDDVDSIAKTAEQLGARLCVPPHDIPEVGRFCVIQDPQGALINVISYAKG